MYRIKNCTACKYPNSVYVNQCVKCGRPLERGHTLRLDDVRFESAIPILSQTPFPESGHDVYFFIDENVVPVPITLNKHIVLGRLDKGEAAALGPFMDLSWSFAHKHGVSRRHAVITRNDNTFNIRDLNSTNGTFLNENRLVPGKFHKLGHNDVIQLGRLQIKFHLHIESV